MIGVVIILCILTACSPKISGTKKAAITNIFQKSCGMIVIEMEHAGYDYSAAFKDGDNQLTLKFLNEMGEYDINFLDDTIHVYITNKEGALDHMVEIREYVHDTYDPEGNKYMGCRCTLDGVCDCE